jgi:hypothetical protein
MVVIRSSLLQNASSLDETNLSVFSGPVVCSTPMPQRSRENRQTFSQKPIPDFVNITKVSEIEKKRKPGKKRRSSIRFSKKTQEIEIPHRDDTENRTITDEENNSEKIRSKKSKEIVNENENPQDIDLPKNQSDSKRKSGKIFKRKSKAKELEDQEEVENVSENQTIKSKDKRHGIILS